MTWTGLCPDCGHDRADHKEASALVAISRDAETILRCSRCSCRVTDDGRPWPAASEEEGHQGTVGT